MEKRGEETMKMWSQLFIDLLTLFTLIVTAVFVIKYWEETQEMKDEMIAQNKISSQSLNEMIAQNKISSQSLKASLLPLIDVRFEKVKGESEMAQFPVEFAYDIFLENKGNGPAFNVVVQRIIIPDKNKQKIINRQTSHGKLGPLSRKIKIIGRGGKEKIHREQSDSYEYVRIEVSYWDHFRDLHKIIFEGDREALELKEYPVIDDYSGLKRTS